MSEINPLEIEQYAHLLTADTFEKYAKSWKNFVLEKKIEIGKEPTKDDFYSYFEKRREDGLCGNTIRALYSHLNKMFQLVSILMQEVNKRITYFMHIIGLWKATWRFSWISIGAISGVIHEE